MREEHSQTQQNKHFYIVNGYAPTWAEEHRNDSGRGLKEYLTPLMWDRYKIGEIDRETAITKAIKRMERQTEKALAEKLAKLERVANAPTLENIDIIVGWKRSAMWGYNPTATADIRTAGDGVDYPVFSYEKHTGTASGCGYDKRSAAVAEALNKSDSVLKVLYTAAENALASGETFFRYDNGCVSWRDVLGYGSGHSILPYFEGGVGVSCFWAILEKCGYHTHSNERRKHTDYYNIFKA